MIRERQGILLSRELIESHQIIEDMRSTIIIEYEKLIELLLLQLQNRKNILYISQGYVCVTHIRIVQNKISKRRNFSEMSFLLIY